MALRAPLSLNPMRTLRMLTEHRFRFLYATIMYSAFSGAFYLVIFPAYMGKCFVGYAQIVLGVAEVSGSYVSGKMSDRIGRTPVFLLGCVCTMLAAGFAAFSPPKETTLRGAWIYFPAFFLYGLGDSTFNTQSPSVLGLFYPKNAASAFAAFRIVLAFVGGLTSSIGFAFSYLPAPWDILTPCIIMWALLVFSVVSWVYLDKRVQSLSPPKKHDTEEVTQDQEVQDLA